MGTALALTKELRPAASVERLVAVAGSENTGDGPGVDEVVMVLEGGATFSGKGCLGILCG